MQASDQGFCLSLDIEGTRLLLPMNPSDQPCCTTNEKNSHRTVHTEALGMYMYKV